ncbi:MAG TPA: N-acetyltransferase [Gammaproteobacteria bacterium]|nr:N-acetyltransferase [Gammaproteobacteria bacterium]
MNLQVREALETDWQAIADLLLAAFGREEGREITDLVAALLQDPSASPRLSLVAVEGAEVVGYILFTSSRIKDSPTVASSAILAPLAVHPDYQGRGIGGRLVEEGLKRLQGAGGELVFVLGHPGYYPKFGFAPAGERGFAAPYYIAPENAEAWMVRELRSGLIGKVGGQVQCADALDAPRYWQE